MSRSRTAPRRLATVLAATGLALTVSLAGQPAQAAATTTDPAQAAAGWLADQLVDGTYLEFFGDPSAFGTIDAALTFAAAGVAGDHAEAAMTWLTAPEVLDSYVDSSPSAHAKALFSVLVWGTDVSHRDLADELSELVEDPEQFDDTFGLSFAVLALERTPDGAPGELVERLADEAQCEDGSFPFMVGGGCGSIDATAITVQALSAAGESEAAADGLSWLVGQQQENGGFMSEPAEEWGQVINASSTGLAAQALRAGGLDESADDAVAFLLSLQVGCEGPIDGQGAVAADVAGFDPATAIFATAQAVLGMAGVGLADLDGTTAQAEAPRLDCLPEPSASPSAPPDGQAGEQLPVTGSSVLALTGAGLLLVGAGGFAVWTVRRRTGPLPTG